MDINDYTGTPKSGMVQAAEDAARIAQLERDVAYWRKRAETAEALAAFQDARLARLEAALPFFSEKWRWFIEDQYRETFVADCTAMEGRDDVAMRHRNPIIQGDAAATTEGLDE